LIALLPSIAFILLNVNQNFPFGGTSILIIVGVGLDTVKQIESQLQQRNYEGSSANATPHHGPTWRRQGYAGQADR
jgi:preprotein translocase subunit SecY